MTAHLGLVHTVPALATRFDAELRDRADDLTLTHVVDAGLLERAIATGVDDAVVTTLTRHLQHLAAVGADPILVTCSSIGEATEQAAAAVAATVIRVDRAMAVTAARRAAAAPDPAVTVLATLPATLGPTQRLLAEEVDRHAPGARVLAHVVDGAAAARAAGDQRRHDELVAAAVTEAVQGGATVVVLAQASMATAVDGDEEAGVPVLTSVPSAVGAVLAAVEDRTA